MLLLLFMQKDAKLKVLSIAKYLKTYQEVLIQDLQV